MSKGRQALSGLIAVALVASIGVVGVRAAGLTGELVVFFTHGTSEAEVRSTVEGAGGTVVDMLPQLDIARVTTDNPGFTGNLTTNGAVLGVVRNHSVGFDKPTLQHRFAEGHEPLLGGASSAKDSGGEQPDGVPNGPKGKKDGPEPFSYLQWDMDMIHAGEAHETATGKGVLVGIIDTGIDAAHPDLAPNFDAELSRNFTTDIPDIDGPCESDPDGSCEDPNDVDEGGHGSHVAGTAAAALNGFGMAGVAPEATLVNLRAGQDSGFFFFFETVEAITYAADNGIDVVNMSFFTDPWLFNCESADDYVEGEPTAEEIEEQAMIRQGVIDAVDYARSNGVTLVAASGNEHLDLAAPTRPDTISPDYPPGNEQERVVTNNCIDVPAEAPGVITVSAIGPSTTKADYSTWGLGVIDVAAPGGWFRDYFGTQDFREPENMILAPWPAGVTAEEGILNKGGNLKDPHFYKKDCVDGHDCAYYTFIQGTSMASPHVTGVVALIIQAHGTPDGNGGFDLDPDTVFEILTSTATDTPCPDPALLDYTDEGRPASWTATCEGTTDYNSNYGDGIVNAAAAVE
ncbi:MAG TPA: S8 family serine peptidase [Actinomycetota bacterium]|nr:S8 family serine peptidase [Actinomycetota bacterium]